MVSSVRKEVKAGASLDIGNRDQLRPVVIVRSGRRPRRSAADPRPGRLCQPGRPTRIDAGRRADRQRPDERRGGGPQLRQRGHQAPARPHRSDRD